MENGTVSTGTSTGSQGSNPSANSGGNSGSNAQSSQSGLANGGQRTSNQPHVGQDSRQATQGHDEGTPNQKNYTVNKTESQKVGLGAGTPENAPEYYEIPVNGKTRRYTVQELLARASKEDASTERFQKAAEIQKKLEERRAKYKQDPISAFAEECQEAGLTPDQTRVQFEKWYKANFIDPETMTPEQKRIAELEKWKQEREREEQSRLEKQQREQAEREQFEVRKSLHGEIVEIMKKHFPAEEGKNPSRFFANRIAYYMRQNLAQGFDAPPETIVAEVNREFGDVVGHVFRTTPMEVLDQKFPELFKRLRKYDIDRLKKQLHGGAPVEEPTEEGLEAPTRKQRKKATTMADVDAYFNSLRRSR